MEDTSSAPQERRKLLIRKTERPETSADSTLPPRRPVEKPRENTAVAFALAVFVSVLVIFGGYKGFSHLHDQVKRISAAESENAETERERDRLKTNINTLSARLENVSQNFRQQEEQGRRELIQRLKNESDAALAILRDRVRDAKSKGAEALAAAISDGREDVLKAEKKVAELQEKIDALEKENREMRAWLSAHRTTIHP